MIVKFQVGDRKECQWAYHDVTKVIVWNNKRKETFPSVHKYSEKEGGSVANLHLSSGVIEQVFYDLAYILNDEGGTINSI